MNRLALLEQQISIRPEDPFPHYAYALELRELGRQEQAIEKLRSIVSQFPNYVPSYYHLGQLLEGQGNPDEARAVYIAGFELATQVGDNHAASELRGALALLEEL